MKHHNPYTADYYNWQIISSLSSAKEVVPLIVKLVKPKSVVDIGCGLGTWLYVFNKEGIKDILGIDGKYIDIKTLLISKNKFLAFDLSKQFKVNRLFDLVISLEVAEHISPEGANNYIDTLTRLGPVIIFSAAIPFQSGKSHINLQWPEYWEKKFKKRGYVLIDCIRNKIWYNNKVDWWYAQNMFVYVRKYLLKNYPLLEKEYNNKRHNIVSIVHPRCYLKEINEEINKCPKSIKSLSIRLLKRVVEKIKEFTEWS